MKIAFFDTKDYDIDSFKKFDLNNQFRYFKERLTLDNVDLVEGFEAICVFVNDVIDKPLIDKLVDYNIKLILLRCAGYNNVDLDYLKDKIALYHVPSYSPYAIAEYTIGLILTLVRKIHKAYIQTRNFNFSLDNLIGFDLHNKTIGVIGTGKIGNLVIQIAKGLSMNVLAYDVNQNNNADYVPLETLYQQSDIITLHCPLNDHTYHMINADSIALMSKKPIIVNTSRGGLIDAPALLNALRARKLSGACLDVYQEESLYFSKNFSEAIMSDEILQGLISLPNVIVTSHQAYLTHQALDAIAKTTILNYFHYQNHITTNKLA